MNPSYTEQTISKTILILLLESPLKRRSTRREHDRTMLRPALPDDFPVRLERPSFSLPASPLSISSLCRLPLRVLRVQEWRHC